MTDVEMEMEMEMKKKNPLLIHEIIRKKLNEWTEMPYRNQMFNKEEAPEWRPRLVHHFPNFVRNFLNHFSDGCKSYQSFDFSIEPPIVGKVKHYSYSELNEVTNFEPPPSAIRQTVSGRLFHGTIIQGSQKRPVIVKTWDFLFPMKSDGSYSLTKFCDEIELFTDERVNTHPNLAKLYGFCVEKRLAVVFDEKYTGKTLLDVVQDDDFGWDKRMKVVIQLADLFSCLHEKKIVFGCVTASCIMIDEEANIKLFDHGYATIHKATDSSILEQPRIPESPNYGYSDKKTMKGDSFVFGFVLVELMAKKKFTYRGNPYEVHKAVKDEAKRHGNYLVHECFGEVDKSTAYSLTLLAFQCVDDDPVKRPDMKDVLNELKAMSLRGVKQKIDHENEAKQNKR